MKNNRGFTIIEVVLVLAIAGLIFLMVFLALPALQRSQRNQQYKNNVSMAVSAVNNYRSNNGGRLPSWSGMDSSAREFEFTVGDESDIPMASYVNASGITEGTKFKIFSTPRTGHRLYKASIITGRILIMVNSECKGSGEVIGYRVPYKVGSAAVITVLENGGDGLVYCENA
jgi:prepilin-type N-terminal cleavage/methylation domain-containing protein